MSKARPPGGWYVQPTPELQTGVMLIELGSSGHVRIQKRIE